MTPTPEELLEEAVRLLESMTKYRAMTANGYACGCDSKSHVPGPVFIQAREFVRQHKERKP